MADQWQQRRDEQRGPRAAASTPLRPPDAHAGAAREIRTVLDKGTQISGKLSFSAPARIEGLLRGEVRAADLLEVAASGIVSGVIWAKTLVVFGEVRGRVLGADRVEIQAGGRMQGLIETRVLVIAEGAAFEGDSRMNPDDSLAARDQPARG